MKLSAMTEGERVLWSKKWLKFKRRKTKSLTEFTGSQLAAWLVEFRKQNGLEK